MSDENNAALAALQLATELMVAWLSNPSTRTSADDVPVFLGTMHQSLQALLGAVPASEAAAPIQEYMPAASVRKSLASMDRIISTIDGKPYKTLRGHLKTIGLTPEQYRERYNLAVDYPLAFENNLESRRAMVKKIGFERKPGAKVEPGLRVTRGAMLTVQRRCGDRVETGTSCPRLLITGACHS